MTSEQTGQDRRRHPRIEELFLLTYVNKDGDEQKTPVLMGRTLDISKSGARVEIDDPVKTGSRMEMEIAIKGESSLVHGKVVRVSEGEGGKHEVGIEFDEDIDLGV